MSPDARCVMALRDYRLDVTFVTGERRRFDMKPLLGWPSRPWRTKTCSGRPALYAAW